MMSHPTEVPQPASDPKTLRLSEVIAAMSAALDVTEGQPAGHAARSCMIGMRLADVIGLPAADRADLFYALLLKDLGCSSNAAKVCSLFGADDRKAKHDLKLVDWARFSTSAAYVARTVLPGGSLLGKAVQFVKVAAAGQGAAREMVYTRCERGALIARQLMLSEGTAAAIRSLDELWDGTGQPDGLAGDQVPLLSRIMNLAQTAEVFHRTHGLDAAFAVVRDRTGTWFDPALCAAFRTLRSDEAFWASLADEDVRTKVSAYEPPDRAVEADAAALDRVAAGFAMVIDAKSPWTHKHSDGVAEIAAGIATEMGLMPGVVAGVRRAGMLHDLGKLGVSNLILDKPGKLDPDELAAMRRHPAYTLQILRHVAGFRDLAEVAAAHHERLDGTGYHRGAAGDAIPTMARILGVADTYEALAAKRPYRQDLTAEEVLTIMRRNVGGGLDPAVFEALLGWLARSGYQPVKLAA
ncbi:MAG TPA: HD domain-containing phosphohydrolase [Humisphaera sp.]